ncbi:hypothetical protein WN48_01889 [Eufriesea mexicana]|uniref:Uncharacterized protein n=1 Tax=Eufriesea mexicana TaxID=516756 RepID=A0A310SBS9_9HYME|nr:hypothetical protein WN48_01889 [Eufriesea mexicana]
MAAPCFTAIGLAKVSDTCRQSGHRFITVKYLGITKGENTIEMFPPINGDAYGIRILNEFGENGTSTDKSELYNAKRMKNNDIWKKMYLPSVQNRPQLNSAYQLPPVTSTLAKESSACGRIDKFQERAGIMPF